MWEWLEVIHVRTQVTHIDVKGGFSGENGRGMIDQLSEDRLFYSLHIVAEQGVEAELMVQFAHGANDC